MDEKDGCHHSDVNGPDNIALFKNTNFDFESTDNWSDDGHEIIDNPNMVQQQLCKRKRHRSHNAPRMPSWMMPLNPHHLEQKREHLAIAVQQPTKLTETCCDKKGKTGESG